MIENASAGADLLHPLTQDWVRRMSIAPPADKLVFYDQFVRSVPDILAKRDIAYLVAPHALNRDGGIVNLANASKWTAVPIGTPAFTANLGITSDIANTNGYDTTYLPDGNGVMKLDSAEIDIFIVDNSFDPNVNSPAEFGNPYCAIKALQTTLVTGAPTTLGGRITRNATFQSKTSGAVTTAIGLTTVTRTGTVTLLMKNGVQVGSAGSAIVGFGTDTFRIGNPVGFVSGTRTIAFCSAGTVLTDAERLRWYAALVILLQQIGSYNPADLLEPPVVNTPDPYAPASTVVWSESTQGTALDMTGLTQTFETVFSTQADLAKITVDGGAGPWFSPIHATAGSAAFMGPDAAVSPYAIDSDGLRIRCEKVNGVWQTGHIQTSDSTGRGFNQTRGYFEARMKMPASGSFGAWPAFWLYGQHLYTAPSETRPEIDVVEYYPGADPRGMHSSAHLRPGAPYQNGQISKHWYKSNYQGYDALAAGGWHTFGCEVTDSFIITYLDRHEVARIPAVAEQEVPFYLLATLQLLGEEKDKAVSPIDLHVDYIRAYIRTP